METINTYYNFNFSIGLNDQTTKKQEIRTEDALKIISKLTIKFLWFWTISKENLGVYTYEDWTQVSEPSFNVNFKTQNPDSKSILEYVENLKKLLNQESILVSYTKENVNFL